MAVDKFHFIPRLLKQLMSIAVGKKRHGATYTGHQLRRGHGEELTLAPYRRQQLSRDIGFEPFHHRKSYLI